MYITEFVNAKPEASRAIPLLYNEMSELMNETGAGVKANFMCFTSAHLVKSYRFLPCGFVVWC